MFFLHKKGVEPAPLSGEYWPLVQRHDIVTIDNNISQPGSILDCAVLLPMHGPTKPCRVGIAFFFCICVFILFRFGSL